MEGAVLGQGDLANVGKGEILRPVHQCCPKASATDLPTKHPQSSLLSGLSVLRALRVGFPHWPLGKPYLCHCTEPRSPEAPGDFFSSQNKEQRKPGAQGIRTQQMRQGTEESLVNAGSGKIRKCHDMR